jgi:hypothetical protein
MAYEVFALAGADFEAAGKKLLTTDIDPHGTVAALTLPGGLRALTVAPAALDTSGEAVFVLGVLVAHADGTAQILSFYVNPAAAKDGAGCSELARRLAATLAPGPRLLDRAAGARALPTFSAGETLEITVGADWLVTMEEGPDFLVHHLRKLSPLGAPTPSIGVYYGDHPSFNPDPAARKEKGALLGHPVEWYAWRADGVEHLQALAVYPGSGSMALHIFITAPDAATLAEARKAVETLRLVTK